MQGLSHTQASAADEVRHLQARPARIVLIAPVNGPMEDGASHPEEAAMEFQNILVKEAPAARVSLNRPDKRNALSLQLMREVVAALEQLARSEEVRAIVVEGAGPVFSAGHDLSEMVDCDVGFYLELFDVCSVMMQAIHRVPQPVIARVHGVATAAGCQLVAACDLAVAAQTARFATPGVKIGLFCSTPMVPVSRAVGRKRAMEMLLTGDFIDATTALEWGLVNRVVPEKELDRTVDELVEKIARSSPLTVGIGKEAFYQQIELDEHRAYDLTKTVMAMNSMAMDAQEGICAFLDKRPPDWKGR
jgi:enoyl-CoA hydratase/carnithine racemase